MSLIATVIVAIVLCWTIGLLLTLLSMKVLRLQYNAAVYAFGQGLSILGVTGVMLWFIDPRLTAATHVFYAACLLGSPAFATAWWHLKKSLITSSRGAVE